MIVDIPLFLLYTGVYEIKKRWGGNMETCQGKQHSWSGLESKCEIDSNHMVWVAKHLHTGVKKKKETQILCFLTEFILKLRSHHIAMRKVSRWEDFCVQDTRFK